MAIIKNEIPILEFDTEQTAVLNPTHENLGLNLHKKCVFAFLVLTYMNMPVKVIPNS